MVGRSDQRPPALSQQKWRVSLVPSSARAELMRLVGRTSVVIGDLMAAAANMVEIAALIGDTARATMLAALMDGQSLTGSELAFLARISRPTASEHLSKLVDARLLSVTKKRSFRYYRIASPLVASMLESLKLVAALEVPQRFQPRSARDDALRFGRTCYDHLAGRLGVAIADSLVGKGYVVLGQDGGAVTDTGTAALTEFGVDLSIRRQSKRIFCKPCLDWSQRRYHIAGYIGSEINRRCMDLGWLIRVKDSRAVQVTAAGESGLHDAFGLDTIGLLAKPFKLQLHMMG